MNIQNMTQQKERYIKYLTQRKWLCLAAAAIIIAIVLFNVSDISGFSGNTAKEKSYKYYTSIIIRKGDTLWSIAEEYMTEEYDGIEEYIREIRRVNHICGDKIYAGEYLAIPCYASEIP